jgi:amino acid adenylation domain-containing protein
VPLDPAYPRERLAFMIEDSRLAVLLTEERLLGALPETAARIEILDASLPSPGAGTRPAPTDLLSPESLAYVIYTSGSTGRPKGAMVPHRGWSNLAEAQRRLFGLGPGDRVFQFASLSFDASAWEIALAFGAGATLVLGPRERRLSQEELTALLRQSTAVLLPPTVLATLEPGDLPGLSALIVGGEACPVELARVWASGRRLWNAYGPTEASVAATIHLYDGGDRLPIGRPIPRMEAHVLDARDHPVPAGVAGQLCLGGPGLARGYLDRPDRTAESFLPHPFAPSPGARLYRTGDLALRRPDGTLEFLGRLDHQVKIRGFRIELGEIEAALASLPEVREVVVIAREDQPGDRRLVAYVTGDAPPDALRSSLSERLPAHMVPATFVVLPAFPLTPNGKVDRKALPAPGRPGSGESFVAPRTSVEELLAAIWSDVLGLERVGATDDFFALGGHSLLAVRLTARIERDFGVPLPLSALFEAPTVEHLARLVQGAPVRRSALVRLHPGGPGRPLFLIHPAGGDVFDYAPLARRLGDDRPVYGIQAVFNADVPEPRLEDLAAEYLAVIREVQPEGPWLLGGWSSGAILAYEIARQIEAAGEPPALLALFDPPPPPDGHAEGLDDTGLLVGFASLGGLTLQQDRLQTLLAGLDLETGLDRLLELAREEGVLPPGVDKPWVRERFALFRRSLTALHHYRPRPYGGPVLFLRAADSQPPGETDLTAGWSRLATIEAHLVPDANHKNLLYPPALDLVLDLLRPALDPSW